MVSDFKNLEIFVLAQSTSKHLDNCSGVSGVYPAKIEFSMDQGGNWGSGMSPGGGRYSRISGLGMQDCSVFVFSK